MLGLLGRFPAGAPRAGGHICAAQPASPGLRSLRATGLVLVLAPVLALVGNMALGTRGACARPVWRPSHVFRQPGAPCPESVQELKQKCQSLLVAANTAGGVAAKIVSPQSIAIAAAAVGSAGQEATITSMGFRCSIILLLMMCGWVYLLSLLVGG